MIRALVVLVLLALISGPLLAHSFYPDSCCSGADCAPIDPRRVKITPGGYLIDNRELVPYNVARWSPDEHFHACFPPTMMGKVGCFWAPRHAM